MASSQYLGALFSALLMIFGAQAQDPDCDYFSSVAAGQIYYVYSPGYPNNYPAYKTCRWQASCPANYICSLNCTVEIPFTTGCTGDRLLISKTGDSSLTGADRYCGTGTISVNSASNALSVGLSTYTNSGRFLCTLGAVQASPPPGTCQCGWKRSTRIVGGVETLVNEYPMMVGLVDYSLRIVYCGATIISKRWVVSAAHCLGNQALANVGVLYGEHNIMSGTETDATRLIGVQQFVIHPQYNNGYDYDIGLARTVEDIVFSDRVGPVCLPFQSSTNTFANYYVDALGWGTTSFGGVASDYLQKVTLQVITQNSCAAQMGSVVTSRTICTFSQGKDTCQYDSGGPLLYQNPSTGRVYLVGIVMGGYGCATDRPGLSSRVTVYLDWIKQNAAGAELCNY